MKKNLKIWIAIAVFCIIMLSVGTIILLKGNNNSTKENINSNNSYNLENIKGVELSMKIPKKNYITYADKSDHGYYYDEENGKQYIFRINTGKTIYEEKIDEFSVSAYDEYEIVKREQGHDIYRDGKKVFSIEWKEDDSFNIGYVEIYNDILYYEQRVSSAPEIIAVDLKTGKEKWRVSGWLGDGGLEQLQYKNFFVDYGEIGAYSTETGKKLYDITLNDKDELHYLSDEKYLITTKNYNKIKLYNIDGTLEKEVNLNPDGNLVISNVRVLPIKDIILIDKFDSKDMKKETLEYDYNLNFVKSFEVELDGRKGLTFHDGFHWFSKGITGSGVLIADGLEISCKDFETHGIGKNTSNLNSSVYIIETTDYGTTLGDVKKVYVNTTTNKTLEGKNYTLMDVNESLSYFYYSDKESNEKKTVIFDNNFNTVYSEPSSDTDTKLINNKKILTNIRCNKDSNEITGDILDVNSTSSASSVIMKGSIITNVSQYGISTQDSEYTYIYKYK